MSSTKFNTFTTEEMQKEIDERKKRSLEYEKYKNLLLSSFNKEQFTCIMMNDGYYANCIWYKLFINNRYVGRCIYNNISHIWWCFNSHGLNYENIQPEKLIETVYEMITEWIDKEIQEVEELKDINLPTEKGIIKKSQEEVTKEEIILSPRIIEEKESILTSEQYKYALERGRIKLDKIPPEFISLDMCKTALIGDIKNINFIPPEFHTYELYKFYILLRFSSLKNVPEKFRDEEICTLAVKKYSSNMKYVPLYLYEKMLLI